jgi:hypothetical protein
LDASVAGIYGSFLTGSGRFLVTWDSGASDQYVSPADGFTVFVATTGSDSDDGLTPERPMKTVTNAVNKIKMFGSSAPFIISAADGTYAGEYFDVTGLNVSIVGDAAVIISSPAAGESSVVRGVGANLHLENVKIEDFVQCAINLSRNSTLTTTNVDLETATATAVGVQLYLDSAYDTTGITYTGSYTHESRYDVQQGVAPTATGLNLGFPIEWDNVYARTINLGVIGSMGLLTISYGTGSPESNVSARIGSLYLRVDGGAGTTLYVKESGAGTNTGWIAK